MVNKDTEQQIMNIVGKGKQSDRYIRQSSRMIYLDSECKNKTT